MSQLNQENKHGFLYPRSRYYGKAQPENVAFNAKLQEFAHQVGYLTNFATSGKLTPEEAYTQMKTLWKDLKLSKKNLGIGTQSIEKS
ncbi:hypothetical protein ACF3DV_15420 [Chlorogloeopsis fritschii PCC 9212]|uniref:Isopropylmalate/homocitrate/citramalate synthases n=1 Tax=Chlorogloeopsis fritschii PCC 6912 TaxID=211165 RepID=A0A3S1FQ25_CHLFR|nr:hypothetical protein [Chlorogloeopsis fritschii]MBF2009610.1 hypothetical protein [Chlorogloeopsis fritschii C42_A2020_084]RUR83428.1 hypothetical protein PCC6912_22610 [Chlorogloeopsis fritschii PCC 6912]